MAVLVISCGDDLHQGYLGEMTMSNAPSSFIWIVMTIMMIMFRFYATHHR